MYANQLTLLLSPAQAITDLIQISENEPFAITRPEPQVQIPAWFFVGCSGRSEDGKQDAIAHAKDSLLAAVASGQPARLKLEAGHVKRTKLPHTCKAGLANS